MDRYGQGSSKAYGNPKAANDAGAIVNNKVFAMLATVEFNQRGAVAANTFKLTEQEGKRPYAVTYQDVQQ